MLKGNNFWHATKTGVALVPQTVAAAGTGTGATITEPWAYGRQITFLLMAGAIGASATATCKVQGLRRDDGVTWEALKEDNGSTDLAFTAASMADAGAFENGMLRGTIDFSRISGDTYKAIRLLFVATTQSYAVAAAYAISDLYKHPSGDTDDIFAKLQPSDHAAVTL